MATIITIKEIQLKRLNNAEYTQYLSNVEALATKATPAKLGVEESLFSAYKTNVAKLTEIAKHSTASKETQLLETLDQDRDSLVVYILTNIKNERKSPVKARKEAATALYLVTKPYIGIQTMPNRQETQHIESLYTDLSRSENAVHITTLGFTEAVATLNTTNQEYKKLTADRTEAKLTAPTENMKQVRSITDEQYREITLRAFAQSVALPSEEASAFIASLNILIDETNTAYKQRMAQAKKQNAG